mgnify:CR=1 FL=1
MEEKEIVEDNSDFKLVRDGCGYTKDEYKIIENYLKEGMYKEVIEKIYQYALEKEKSYNKEIKCPKDFLPLLRKYAFEKQEKVIVFTVDNSLKVIGEYVASVGILNKSLMHPREIFKKAINDSANAIFIAHNHPSGIKEFSTEDIEITKKIENAGKIIDIELLDHILVGYNDEMKKIFIRSYKSSEIYLDNIKNKEVSNER